MNIIYLTNHLNIGGISSYVLSLVKGLKHRGHNVYIASSQGELLPRVVAEGIDFIHIPINTKSEISPKIIISKLALRTFISQNCIQIIHSNTRTTSVLGSLLSRKTQALHISTCHGFFKKRLFRKLFPCWGKKVIAISEAVKQHLIADFMVNPQDIIVINNGIDIKKFKVQSSKFKEETKQKIGIKDELVVGIIARLSDVKGHSYLIQAMKNVLDRKLKAKLLIIGGGKLKNRLIKLTKDLKIDNSVLFIDSVFDTVAMLSIMDVFVMPSLKEGLGLSLMEAMACGLAVIGSDVGGIKSLIRNGQNGILVEPANIAKLTEGLCSLLTDSETRKRLGENAQTYIRDNFSEDKMILRTEEAYSQCLDLKN